MRRMKIPRLPACVHRFTVDGLNLERFLNAVSKEGIPLRRVERTHSRGLCCECFSADLPALRSLVQEKGWRMENVQPLGLSALWNSMLARPGIPIGAVLAVAAALILSQFIWQVDVRNAGAYQTEVRSFLSESGFAPGMMRRSIDAKALERTLSYRYPEVAWFRVYATGITLVVEVTQGTAPPALPDASPQDVYAQHDGIVESIRVYAGTAAVKPGQAVKTGDVLIRGMERAADGAEAPVAAEGVVMARCWRSVIVRMPLKEIISQETGRETVWSRIRMPVICWPEAEPDASFLAWNTYVERLPIGGCFLPVQYERVTQREVSMEFQTRTEAEVRSEAEKAAFQHLKNTLFGNEIIDKWVDYCMIEDEILALSATAEWLMDISGKDLP